MSDARKKRRIVYLSIAMAVVLLNLAAWNSTAFCDAYIAYVFPVWVNLYGRITGLFPFSVGEWMIAAGIFLVFLAVLGLPALAAASALRRDGWKRGLRRFYSFFAWVLLIVCAVMTLNCFILYHASTFSEKYFGQDDGDYTLEELLALRNYVVGQCNRLSGQVERETDGSVRYTGKKISDEGELSGGTEASGEGEISSEYGDADRASAAMKDQAREAMRKLGQTYSQLDGWYPRPKALLCSDFLCQQHMQGYYFPFSMEANYNDVMEVMRKPATMCHELAHLRGYIYEDEANFIGYLACTQSEDICFQYSGYLSVLNYLENDLRRASASDPEGYERAVKAVKPLQVYETVRKDNVFVSEEEWARINGKSLFDTDSVDQVTDTLVDASLKANGISDGKVSYSRVVRLLLQYYRASGFKFENFP